MRVFMHFASIMNCFYYGGWLIMWLQGITVKLDDSGVVVVSRVMEGSNVHRQGANR